MSISNSTTSIEEIVKFQQELLNHQRNQKAVQKETFKLLDLLNKSIKFMSDRLDQFAMRTNVNLQQDHANQHRSATTTSSSTKQANSNNSSSSNYDDVFNSVLNSCNNFFNSNRSVPNNHNHHHHYHQHSHGINGESNNKTIANNNLHANVKTKVDLNSSRLSDKTNTSDTRKPTTSNVGMSDDSNAFDLSFGNGSSDEEEDETETIQARKKVRIDNELSLRGDKSSKDSEESNNQQRLFNKYVRESVEKRLGKEFLLLHEIQEISQELMEEIRNDALNKYPPINIRPRRAWHLAKASLRCRRRSLRRQKEKTNIVTIKTSPSDTEDVLLSTHIAIPTATTSVM